MADSLPASEDTRNEFLRRYGAAMSAWANVERELGTLFSFVTGMQPAMATQVFYSARSFNGRADMFKAALVTAETKETIKTLARAIIRKATRYNQCRAALAHDQPNYDYKGGIILVQGRAQFQSDEVKKLAVEQAITMDQLQNIAVNFEAFAKIIWDVWCAMLMSKTPSLDKYHERLALLPTAPHEKAPPSPAAAPKNRRQASRE